MLKYLSLLAGALLLCGCPVDSGKSSTSQPTSAAPQAESPYSASQLPSPDSSPDLSPPSSASLPSSQSAPSPASEPRTPTFDPGPLSHWGYETEKDELRGKNSYFAFLDSAENQSTNYLRPNRVTLILRRNSQNRKAAYFFIPRGKFDCSFSSGCMVMYKFDDGELKTMLMHPSQRFGEEGDAVFIDNPVAFTKELRQAKSLLIEFNLYGYGREQYRFYPRGLEWSHW